MHIPDIHFPTIAENIMLVGHCFPHVPSSGNSFPGQIHLCREQYAPSAAVEHCFE